MANQTFDRQVQLPVPVDGAFAWHERPGALDRLIPPWEDVRVAERSEGINDGARVVLSNRIGPFRLRWVAEHYGYHKNQQFRDLQISGPFAHWDHLHSFRSDGPTSTVLTDRVEYRIRGGALGRFLAGRFVGSKVEQMFAYRHNTTSSDLTAHARHQNRGLIHVAMTGSSGLVGSNLRPFLTTGGHRVTRMVRNNPADGDVLWNPVSGHFDPDTFDGVDAVVHLAGENIAAGRWNERRKKRIRESRVDATRQLCIQLAQLKQPPSVLVSASATGIYGNRGADLVDESSEAGSGFLADVARQWEDATRPAREAGIRVVHLRFGIILSPRGGALQKMLTPFQLGAGGIVGNGDQYWSWISIDDAVGAVYHALMTESLVGAVNAVAPAPVTNREFTRTLGRVLHRPTVLPVPSFATRLALGELANELVLSSCRVQPTRLIESDYKFRHSDLESALRHVLGRT